MSHRTKQLAASTSLALALAVAGATASFAEGEPNTDEQTIEFARGWLQDKGYPNIECRAMTQADLDYDFVAYDPTHAPEGQYAIYPHVRGTKHLFFDEPVDGTAVCSVDHPTADGPESYYVDRLEAGFALGAFDTEGGGAGAKPQDCWTIAGAGGTEYTADRGYEYVVVYDQEKAPTTRTPVAAGETISLLQTAAPEDHPQITEVVACSWGAKTVDDAGAPIGPVVQTDHPTTDRSGLAQGALAAGLLAAAAGLGMLRRSRA